jgi:DNA invertase Pin-like site-specific DNA recombinase
MNDHRISHPLITRKRLALRAVIYIRQSSPAQVRENWGSTEVQREQVELARAYGWPAEAIEVIEEDLGKSGRSTRGRSGWDRMLHLIVGGCVGAVFAYDVKRISREVRDFSELLVLCRYHGVALVLDSRPVDPNNPGDAALAQMQATFAELDNRTRAETLKRAKHAKARQGAIVAQLPVGWTQISADEYDFDPVARPAIEQIYALFRQLHSVRQTVRALNESGVSVPTRYRGGRLEFKEATMDRIRRFLTLPAYAGTVVFGQTEHLPEFGLCPSGLPRRKPVPIDRQTRHPGRIPAYITEEEQEQFRAILRENSFRQRTRAGRGAALCQGLIKCGRCGALMTVAYPERNHGSFRYQCTEASVKHGAKPCCSLQGEELDAAVERIFVGILRAPPRDYLRQALAEVRETERARQGHAEAERKRLEFQEQQARDRYENVDSRNRLLAADLEKRLEEAMRARREFEERLASRVPRSEARMTESEIEGLCEMAEDAARVLRHPTVTNQERKALLRCVVAGIVVNRTPYAVEGTIMWKSGEGAPFKFWRQAGVDQLIKRLHDEGLTAREIRDRLANGDLETGQHWVRTTAAIYQALRRLGVRPHSAHQKADAERQEIRRLYSQGKTVRQIVGQLNAAGSNTPTGKAWTVSRVYPALGYLGRIDRYEDLHRNLLADAKRRGLTAQKTAEELNENKVPRTSDRPWTADAVRQRRRFLKAKAKKAAELERAALATAGFDVACSLGQRSEKNEPDHSQPNERVSRETDPKEDEAYNRHDG